MKQSKYNISSWPMQEIDKYDGWRTCSCPSMSKRTDLQNIHLSAPEVKCRWPVSTVDKIDPRYLQVGAGSRPFFSLWRPEQRKAPGPFVQKDSSERDFVGARGRKQDILPRPTEFLAKGKHAQSCARAQGLLVYAGLLSATGCLWKPVELTWALHTDSGMGKGPVKSATLNRLF